MEYSKKRKDSVPHDAATASKEAKHRPVHTIRIEDCSASIWLRESVVQGKPQTFYSVTLERSYKDRDSSWKYTKTFDPDSLGRIADLCRQCYEWIHKEVTGG